MFTGIIESVEKIQQIQHQEDGISMRISSVATDLSGSQIGSSIAVSGICLTIIDFTDVDFEVFVSNETSRCSKFSELEEGSSVNIERPLTVGKEIGGHIVSGHVDGLANCTLIHYDGASMVLKMKTTAELGKYIAAKGSITMDGVSMTVNEVSDVEKSTIFSVNVIPHTGKSTTLGSLTAGDDVHIEVDMLARYLERLTTN